MDHEASEETVVDHEASEETVTDKDAYDESVVDHEAYDESVTHPAVICDEHADRRDDRRADHAGDELAERYQRGIEAEQIEPAAQGGYHSRAVPVSIDAGL